MDEEEEEEKEDEEESEEEEEDSDEEEEDSDEEEEDSEEEESDESGSSEESGDSDDDDSSDEDSDSSSYDSDESGDSDDSSGESDGSEDVSGSNPGTNATKSSRSSKAAPTRQLERKKSVGFTENSGGNPHAVSSPINGHLKSAMKPGAEKSGSSRKKQVGDDLEEEMSAADLRFMDGDSDGSLDRMIAADGVLDEDDDTGEDVANRMHDQQRFGKSKNQDRPILYRDLTVTSSSFFSGYGDETSEEKSNSKIESSAVSSSTNAGPLGAVGGLFCKIGELIGIVSPEDEDALEMDMADNNADKEGDALSHIDYSVLTDKEKERAKAVYDRCTADVTINLNLNNEDEDATTLGGSVPVASKKKGKNKKSRAAKARGEVEDDIKDPHKMTFDKFQVALSFLGFQETFERIRTTFDMANRESINLDKFLKMLAILIGQENQQELERELERMFDGLYIGTCQDDSQRDEFGRKYLDARQFRIALTSVGGVDNVLTVEEADELIRETHPILVYEGDNPVATERIYFEQYRSMLLNHDP